MTKSKTSAPPSYQSEAALNLVHQQQSAPQPLPQANTLASPSADSATDRPSVQQKPHSQIRLLASKTGRWTLDEHLRFIEALQLFGKEWKLVQMHV